MNTEALSCQWVGNLSGPKPQMAVILCHGFGAMGNDLVPLGHHLLSRPALKDRVVFIFPEGPLSLAEWGYGPARAWWLIDFERIARLQRRDAETMKAMRENTPEGLPVARRLLMALIEQVCQKTGLGPRQVALGGFSQGAMLTTDVSLRLEEAPCALGVFSGTLISETEWQKRALARNSMPVFQAHGHQDEILPYEGGEALRSLFDGAGFPLTFYDFQGGHTITEKELSLFGEFLEARLETLTS